MIVCRIFSAFAIAPALALGPAVVSETYFVQERPARVVRSLICKVVVADAVFRAMLTRVEGHLDAFCHAWV